MLHSLAIHHSLPRMIKEDVDDPADWVLEHSHLPTPGESSLGPLVTFSRMCRLYADSLGAMNGDSSNMRMLSWIELEWKRWRNRWLEDNGMLHSKLLKSIEKLTIKQNATILFSLKYPHLGCVIRTSDSIFASIDFYSRRDTKHLVKYWILASLRRYQ